MTKSRPYSDEELRNIDSFADAVMLAELHYGPAVSPSKPKPSTDGVPLIDRRGPKAGKDRR